MRGIGPSKRNFLGNVMVNLDGTWCKVRKLEILIRRSTAVVKQNGTIYKLKYSILLVPKADFSLTSKDYKIAFLLFLRT